MAVAHDGSHLRGRIVGAIAFGSVAIVDWSTRPAAPVGVVGAEVVPKFVCHDVEVPAVVVQVVDHGGAQVGAETSRIRCTAIDTEVGNAPCAGVGTTGQEVHKVTGPIGKVWVLEPFEPEGVEHGTGVAGVGCIGIGGFPHVDVRCGEGNEVVEFRLVDFAHATQQGEGPFN